MFAVVSITFTVFWYIGRQRVSKVLLGPCSAIAGGVDFVLLICILVMIGRTVFQMLLQPIARAVEKDEQLPPRSRAPSVFVIQYPDIEPTVHHESKSLRYSQSFPGIKPVSDERNPMSLLELSNLARDSTLK